MVIRTTDGGTRLPELLREADAAAFVGVSKQTLYRYRKSGKLAYKETKGTTRPVIEYDHADLSRFKDELNRKRRIGKKPAKASLVIKPRINLRLSQDEYDTLTTESAKYGMTGGEYAHRLMREGLEARFREEAGVLRAELARTNADIKRMHKEFASAFEVILEYVGLSPEESKKWVTDNLR